MKFTHGLTTGLMMACFALVFSAAPLQAQQGTPNASIRDGVRNGSLTPTEAVRLRAERRQLRRQVVRNRNDGNGLTRRERKMIRANARQNGRLMVRLKNNRRTR